jgi:hypothetical protein
MTSEPKSKIRQPFKIESGILASWGDCLTQAGMKPIVLGFGESQCDSDLKGSMRKSRKMTPLQRGAMNETEKG